MQFVCIGIAVLGILPSLIAQSKNAQRIPTRSETAAVQGQPHSNAVGEGFAQTVYSGGPNQPVNQIASLNGAINPAVCTGSSRPAWCRGTEIGAWTNSAIALIRCGEVYIPAGTYTQTTSIMKPRCVKLHGASASSTFLKWTPSTGPAIILADATGLNAYAPEGALEDLTLIGPGANTRTCGIYIGGSNGVGCAPSTSIDPKTNFGDHENVNRIRIYKSSSAGAFGVGIQWGNYAWSDTIFESDIAFNGTGIFVPGSTITTGENLSILNSYIQDNFGVGLKIATGNNINFSVINTSLDYNGSWAVQNGTAPTQNAVSLVNCYIAQRSHWLQNYGYMNLTGVYANDAADSAVLGYLVDNEAPFLTVTGGQFFNNGTGAILNPAGVASTWIAPEVTNPGPSGLTPTMTYIDRLGDVAPSALYTDIFNQNGANRFAGTSACVGGTQTVAFFAGARASLPVVLVFDETTKGGVNLTMKAQWGFTVSCAGASDVFDWIVIGNPN